MDRDRDRENAPQIDAAALEREREREAKQGKNKSTSHVPCRFFRMGMCDKGEGCVFSHDLSERESVFLWRDGMDIFGLMG